MRHSVVSAGQGLDYDWSNDHIYIKTPFELTDGRVTVAEDLLKPGFHLARHHHRQMVEVFYVLDGEVTFKFDDETIIATPRTTINVPQGTWHEVTCAEGGRLITIFTPGGFDHFLAELSTLTQSQLEDAELMAMLNEKYDIWTG